MVLESSNINLSIANLNILLIKAIHTPPVRADTFKWLIPKMEGWTRMRRTAASIKWLTRTIGGEIEKEG